MVVRISASVGQGGVNKNPDVLAVQKALNRIPGGQGGLTAHLLKEDGLAGMKTSAAITAFQKLNIGLVPTGRIDVNSPTLTRLNSILDKLRPPAAPHFTDQNLYGPQGPSPADIEQNDFGDCYFVATLAALAQQSPKVIRDAIYYDPNTQQFQVRLYDLKGRKRYIWVTQTELQCNVNSGGGSTVDNTGKYERVWPDVIEAAYAKMYSNPNDSMGIASGYLNVFRGGVPADALMTITGSAGTEVAYELYLTLGRAKSVAVLGGRVAAALRQHKSVILRSKAESPSLLQYVTGTPAIQDGLVNRHDYSVVSMQQNGTDWNVTARNPWNTNMDVGEGKDTPSATITVSLKSLVATGGLRAFQVSSY
jgi:hypothetical protein